MFRPDIIWILPSVGIAYYQIKYIWSIIPEAKKEDTEISGKYTDFHWIHLRNARIGLYILLILQLFFPILSITNIPIVITTLRIIGYAFVGLGFVISYTALQMLGNNWSGMEEYRIKKGQKLVTSGVYAHIRHPIYTAVLLEIIGFELIVNSWLWLYIGIIVCAFMFWHCKNEDTLLAKKFGGQFIQYKQRTKAFIPFIL